ncbi:F-box/WD repeat-containing protein 9, partial [Ceratobasidium sp. 394]
MFEELKKGLRRIKDSARSRSRSRATTPTPAQSQGIGSITPAATSSAPRPPPSPLPVTSNVPAVVVSPDPDPGDNTQNPGSALALPTPSTGEQNAGNATGTAFKALLEVLKRSSDTFGPLKEAVGGLSRCIDIVEQEAKAREDYKKLRGELEVIFNDLSGYLGCSAPPTMTPVIESISKSIKQEVDIISQKERRNRLERTAEAMQDADGVLECYRRIQMLLGRLTVNANMSMWETIDEQTTELRLAKLPNAPTAMYRSTESDNLRRVGCTPNTRVDVLEQLRMWASDSTSENVYWLNGMAGTGKTTIAYSLCDHLQRGCRLGASFFCTRQLPECRNINRIVPSISYQLSRFSLPFRHTLSGILEQNKDIHHQPLQDQFEQLIVAPLRQVAHTFAPDVTIVIDALDECEDKDGVDRILGVLLSHASNLSVKFFVTSRPEPKILDQMRSRTDAGRPSELRLHELDRIIVQQDVTTYLKHNLKRVELSDADMNVLAERSGVLFIYAATVVRYLEYDNFSRSKQRLRMVLDASGTASSDAENDLNLLYATILDAAFNNTALG